MNSEKNNYAKIAQEALKQHKKEHIQTLLPDLRARVLADAERHAREGDSYFFLESESYPELNRFRGEYKQEMYVALERALRKDLKKHRLHMDDRRCVYIKRDYGDALFCIGLVALVLMMVAMTIAFIICGA